jgi:hypothetical protein
MCEGLTFHEHPVVVPQVMHAASGLPGVADVRAALIDRE